VGVAVSTVLALGLFVTGAWAHGVSGGAEDRCRFKAGPYYVHFTAYQPEGPRPDYEYCEDLPATGLTVIVLDYLDLELRDLRTEVRIVRDTGTRPVGETDTLVRLPPQRYPTGSVTIEHVFDAPGAYVSLVTVGESGQFTSRFRFSVGQRDYTTYYLIAAAVGAGIALYLYTERKRKTPRIASL